MGTSIFYRVEVKAGAASLDVSPDIISLSLDQREVGPDQLSLQLEDPHAVLGHALREGSLVEVELGTGDESAILFRGKIYQTAISLPERGVATVTLTAYDGLMELGLTEVDAVHESPLFDCVGKALGNSFHDVDYDVSKRISFQKVPCVQRRETNLHFLQRLARATGCLLFVRPGATAGADTVCFVERAKVVKSNADITLTYGRPNAANPLLHLQAKASISGIKPPTRFVSLDEEGAKVTEDAGTKDAMSIDDELFTEGLGALELRDARRAQAIRRLAASAAEERRSLVREVSDYVHRGLAGSAKDAEVREIASAEGGPSESGLEASGVAEGRHKLTARTTVKIENVRGFTGTWLLTSARHVLDKQGYRTEIQCRR